MKYLILVLALLLVACTQTIREVKSDDYLNKEVKVKGTVELPVRIGEISGYTLIDENKDSIIVSSKELPDRGDEKTVKGTLKKGLLGYYIDAN